MNEKLLKSQKMLLGVLGALLFMLIICAVSTAKDVPAEKELTLLTPDRIQNIDEETRQADLTIDQNNEDRSSLAFFTSHQYVHIDRWGIYNPLMDYYTQKQSYQWDVVVSRSIFCFTWPVVCK